MNNLLLSIGLTWAIIQGYEMYSTLKAVPITRWPKAILSHIWMCSKCMSWWITLGLTQNIGLAALASIGFSLYSHYINR